MGENMLVIDLRPGISRRGFERIGFLDNETKQNVNIRTPRVCAGNIT